jgi:hypothetical protein
MPQPPKIEPHRNGFEAVFAYLIPMKTAWGMK